LLDLLISAVSLSQRAAASLRPGVTGRALASFRSVCDLATDAGEVVALVWGAVGNGPLNVVLNRGLEVVVPAGARFAVMGQVLRVGEVVVDLSRAARWDARPDWERLRARRGAVVAAARAAQRSIAGLREQRLLKQAGPAVAAAVTAFQQAWRQTPRTDLQSAIRDLRPATCNLCGLGPGLTPAGDDWLAGWLLGQHLGGDLRGLVDLEGLIIKIAAGRTTTLARAFLECAAAGEADEAWHELFDALAQEDANQQSDKSANQQTNESVNQRTSAAMARIMRHGATSGAAMLAGFFSAVEMLASIEN